MNKYSEDYSFVIITDSEGVTQTVTTDSNGDWSASVPRGTTEADVDESDADYPSGYTQTEGDDPSTVTAVAGSDTDAGDDGCYLAGTISGHLYLYTNGNGTQDVGEPDLADVDVIITDSEGVTQTISTDANGNWIDPSKSKAGEHYQQGRLLSPGIVLTENHPDSRKKHSITGQL